MSQAAQLPQGLGPENYGKRSTPPPVMYAPTACIGTCDVDSLAATMDDYLDDYEPLTAPMQFRVGRTESVWCAKPARRGLAGTVRRIPIRLSSSQVLSGSRCEAGARLICCFG